MSETVGVYTVASLIVHGNSERLWRALSGLVVFHYDRNPGIDESTFRL